MASQFLSTLMFSDLGDKAITKDLANSSTAVGSPDGGQIWESDNCWVVPAASWRFAEGTAEERLGLVRPDTWARTSAEVVPSLVAPFAELFVKTSCSFVTKVNDVLCNKASVYGGHFILVGDDLMSYRSHTRSATEQAALRCLTLEKVYQGQQTHQMWDRETCLQAQRTLLYSRVVGILGTGAT
ncbi:hypothetical protein SLS62_009089 [Diatrype stigma]|uniref:Uncharacterized protein n=1 Tax=Diatrype stigma TaxID=117547 RepID=A0AAN9YMD3_9PEZI